MQARCFDLGGSGLKTCTFIDGKQTSDEYRIGCAPDRDTVATWIRKAIPSLEYEIKNGFAFSFSLAGLDKLATAKDIFNDRSPLAIAGLFRLPESRVKTLNDGDAHLIASAKCLSMLGLQHLNCSIGTGVGFGYMNANGKLVSERQLLNALPWAPWDLVTDSSASIKAACFALAKDGWKELCMTAGIPAATVRFENRWVKFLTNVFLPPLLAAGWDQPAEITFTGGIVDNHPLWSVPTILNGARFQRGPRHAGLTGALMNLSIESA